MEISRSSRARATKLFEAVRIGAVRLHFSHFELIGFQLDGDLPVVTVPLGQGSGCRRFSHQFWCESKKIAQSLAPSPVLLLSRRPL